MEPNSNGKAKVASVWSGTYNIGVNQAKCKSTGYGFGKALGCGESVGLGIERIVQLEFCLSIGLRLV
ncbi:hypothetical protein N7475_005731 [Penicillium sp. IBT 31633x]|nr:hypothetical protein N7475_005731 [Penicillium sp. IBT 31633x]